jgi:hypothetical protein
MRNDSEDSYSSSGSAFLYFLGGLGLGALFMYLTDPDMGRRRRALLLDQYAHAKRAVRDGTEAAVRDATNRVGGLIGKQYGRLKIWKDKSYVGTAAVFGGTFLATLAVISFYSFLNGYIPSLNVFYFSAPMAVAVAAIVGVFVATVELFSPGKYDNIIVPLSTAALVLCIEWLLGA